MLKYFGIGSLLKDPRGFSFNTQQPDEEMVILLRKHWVTWLRWLIPGIALIVLPLFLESLFISHILAAPIELRFPIRLSLWLFIASMGVFYLVESWLIWYFSCDIVTTKRVVDISFIFPFYKKVSESSLIQIQDISNVSDGLFQSVLDYGDIRIETAGETSEAQIQHSPNKESENSARTASGVPDFIFSSVPKPDWVQKQILEQVSKLKEEKFKTLTQAL